MSQFEVSLHSWNTHENEPIRQVTLGENITLHFITHTFPFTMSKALSLLPFLSAVIASTVAQLVISRYFYQFAFAHNS